MTELDIQQFIDQAQDDVPSDVRVVVPEEEYPMYVKPGSTKIITGTSDKNGKVWARYNALCVIDDQAAREAVNLETPTARMSFFLDITEDSTEEHIVLAKGVNRNTTLGKLLKSTGNDHQGWAWGDIEGVPFKGRVKHKASPDNPENVNAEVVAITKL